MPTDLLLTPRHLVVPSGKTNNRPAPTRSSVVGPVSLWLPAAQATNSAPADRCLPERWMARCCCDPWCSWCSSVGSQPGYKQWLSNHREWYPSSWPGRNCGGRSHTIGEPVRAPDRPLRPPGHRPADLDHRPLQLPLHLLHAGGGHALAARATSCSPTRSIARIARVCVERFGFEAIRHHRRRAHASGRTCPGSSRCSRPLGVDIAMTTNGVKLPELAARPRRPPGCGASTSRSTRCAASVSSRSPAATSSTGCSPASTPPSTPGSTR